MTKMKKEIRLFYPPELLHIPIINQLIHRFNISLNILRAQINTHEGWIDVQIEGTQEMVEQATQWLKASHIEVAAIPPEE